MPVSVRPPRRTWETAHLRRLSAAELNALVGVMPAWLHHQRWNPPEGCDKALLWKYIDSQGLGGALGGLAAAGLVADEEIAPRAIDCYISNSLHFETARRVCGRIARSANELGLSVLNLKGPVLADQAYGDTGIRSFSDIDLWTSSRAGLLKLFQALDARIVEDNDLLGPVRRMRGPGSIVAAVDHWEIEARYPSLRPTDPMLQLLTELGTEHWSQKEGVLAAPSPSMHLLILLFHMSWYHYFSRFIWFLDVAALVSRRKDEIDLEWVQFQARRLETANALGLVAQFCRQHIDEQFPSFPLDATAWNYRFLNVTADCSVIASGRFSLQQRRFASLVRILWLRVSRHYLLADPADGRLLDSRPLYWLTATIAWGLHASGRAGFAACRLLAYIALYPAARITCWISQKPFNGEAFNAMP